MAPTGHLTLYGDMISGNCHKTRFVADRLGIRYRWVETSVLKRETQTPEFLAMNPAGQVPLLVLEDGRPLAESGAILLFLAEGSDLIPTDAYDRAVMHQWMFWEQYTHEPAVAVMRFHKAILGKPESAIDPSLRPRSEKALTIMDRHLSTRPYFTAGRLTLADIALVSYTRLAPEAGFDLARWPSVSAWVRRVEQDLGLIPAGKTL